MSSDEIPADVRAFIHARIPSVGHMEALVLTLEEPEQAWTVENTAKRLFVTEAKCAMFLRDLAGAGLLERASSPERWRFAPASEALAELARRSVQLYRQRLLAMTSVIRSGADPGRQLADAFRFRRE